MALRWWLGASDDVWRKTNHQKFAFVQSIKYRSFHMLLPTSCVAKWYQWLRIWLSRNIRFVGVSVGMSARNRHFQTNYWCIISYRQISSSLEAAWCYGAKIIVSLSNLTGISSRQWCCRGACQIAERLDKSKPKSRGFEASRDLAVGLPFA